MAETELTTSVWEDALGKHMRWAAEEMGVALQLDILPGTEAEAEDQAAVAISIMANLHGLMNTAMDLVDEIAHEPGCDCQEVGQ